MDFPVDLSGCASGLGHFQVGFLLFLEPYRRSIYLMEALYTLNSPPVVSFK